MADTTFPTPRGWRGSLGLGHKMRLVLGGLVALMMFVLVLAVLLVARLGADETRLSQNDLAFASATSDGALQAKGVANDERGFLISGDPHYVDEATARIASARSALRDAERTSGDHDQLRLVQAASAGFERWVEALQQEFSTYDTDKAAAIKASLGPTRDLRKAYEANLARAQALGHASVTAGVSAVSATAARSTYILLVCLGIVFVAGVVASTWVIHVVAVPLHRLATILAA